MRGHDEADGPPVAEGDEGADVLTVERGGEAPLRRGTRGDLGADPALDAGGHPQLGERGLELGSNTLTLTTGRLTGLLHVDRTHADLAAASPCADGRPDREASEARLYAHRTPLVKGFTKIRLRPL